MDHLTLRQRNRVRHHYTMISNVIIFGYPDLTDSEKLTYQAIDSFDWSDGEGHRKGYAYPSVDTLARRRGVDRRTVFRHLAALERAGLLTREQRPGHPTLLWIEEPSKEQCDRYLATTARGDTAVTPTRDMDVTPYKEDESETDKDVNADQVTGTAAGLKPPFPQRPSSSTHGPSQPQREYYAQQMLSVLSDPHSLGCYRRIATVCPPDLIFEALSIVKDATHRGAVKRTRGAMFVDLIKRLSMDRGIQLEVARDAGIDPQKVGPPTTRSP